jgi:hypothetical protein
MLHDEFYCLLFRYNFYKKCFRYFIKLLEPKKNIKKKNINNRWCRVYWIACSTTSLKNIRNKYSIWTRWLMREFGEYYWYRKEQNYTL